MFAVNRGLTVISPEGPDLRHGAPSVYTLAQY